MIQNYQNLKTLISKLNSLKGILLFALAFFAGSSEILLAQQTYTFTNATATGSLGPTQTQINTAYLSTNLNGSVVISPTAGIQTFTVPTTGGYRIECRGGQGVGPYGGRGASMAGDFTLTAGTVLKILVGQKGEMSANTSANAQYGGGGGSFVTSLANVPYVIAGGGGGSWATSFQANSDGTVSTSGNNGANATDMGAGGTAGGGGAGSGSADGGGGLNANGVGFSAPGIAFVNGGTGGTTSFYGVGGFGGGAGTSSYNDTRGGGGGGYSGGGGAHTGGVGAPQAGGGGSYNNGANQLNASGTNTGQGLVLISELCNIKIFSSGTNSLNPSICVGQSLTLTTNAASNYTWSNGNTTNTSIVVSPAVTTTYSLVGTSSLNCVAAAVITVTVSSGLPVLSISNPSNNICLGRTGTLTASGALTYTWTGGVTNAQSFTPTATSSYTVSGQNGCGISTAVTSITVSPLAVTVISTPTIVCAGSTATLTAASAVNGYTWQPGPLIGNNPVVGPIANTVYTVTASDGTCSGVATVTLTTKPIPTLSIVSSATTACVGAVVTMTASGAISYTWSTPANVNGASISVNPTGPTLYAVTGSNSVGCTASANQVVLTNPSPTVTISANKTIACEGEAVNLLAGGSGATSYAWTNGPATAGYTINPTSSAVYSVSGTGLGCTVTSTIQISVINATLNVSATNPSICIGATTTITASGANTYSWTGFPLGANAIVSPLSTTIYTVNAITTASSINCTLTKNISVTVFSLPTLSITATKTVMCKADSGPRLTVTGAVTYTWSNNATTTTINVTPTILNNTYSVVGTDANGCSNDKTIQIQVNSCNGITGLSSDKYAILIYPNPSNGEFFVSSDSDINLKIINELGQDVSYIVLTAQNDHRFTVSNLASGIYFILGRNENGSVNQKIVISK